MLKLAASEASLKPKRLRSTARSGVRSRINAKNNRAIETSDGPRGNKLTLKPSGCFRVCFQNINGLPVHHKGEKHNLITTMTQQIQTNYFGMSELNINFNIMHPNAMWRERFKTAQHTHHTYNIHSNSRAKVLYGGIGALLSTEATHRCNGSGADPTGLGRWSWSQFTGKGGMFLRIITAYQPTQDSSN